MTNRENEAGKNSSPGSSPDQHGKASGVNAGNFYAKARMYIELNSDTGAEYGYSINPVSAPQQWGAWRHYLKSIKRPTTFMDQRGQDFKRWSDYDRETRTCFTVPAPMPSDFDAGREWLTDLHAGDRFFEEQNKPRRPELTSAQRAEVVRVTQEAARRGDLKGNLDWRPGQ